MEVKERTAGPDFGTLLRRHRLAAGLSQEALADRARMSSEGISALERGHRRTPQRETVVLLAGALVLSPDQRKEFEAAARRSAPRRISTITVGPWPGAEPSDLPLSLASFVGRSDDLSEIAALLEAHRLITITGPGGVGKTQLALRTLRRLGEPDTGSTFFAALAPVRDPSLVTAIMASALGIQEVPNYSLLDTLIAYIKDRPLLLLIDNCEHVVAEAATAVERILSACPRVRILATSREPLRTAGECVYRLRSLDASSSTALFATRAQAVNRHFVLSEENLDLVTEICQRLDGIPLAIELAAARTNLLTLEQIAKKLDSRLPLLSSGQRTAMPRQQTMRGTIDWSYDLLQEPERRVFEQFSIFAGGCTLEAAVAICAGGEAVPDQVVDCISALVDKSLVAVDFTEAETRYRLLECFWEYAREKLAARGTQDIAARRHALYFLDLANELDYAEDYDPARSWRLARADSNNWQAALRWTLTDGNDVLLGQRLVGDLTLLWRDFMPLSGLRWTTRALDSVDGKTPAEVQARLHYTQATIAMAMGNDDLQISSSAKAVSLYRDLKDMHGIAISATRAATSARELRLRKPEQLGELTLKPLLEQALQVAREEDNKRLIGFVLRSQAGLCDKEDEARALIREAIANLELVEAKNEIAFALLGLSWIDWRCGDSDRACDHACEALDSFRALNHPRGIAIALNIKGAFLLSMGRYDEAAEGAREVLDIARQRQLVDNSSALAIQQLATIAALQPPKQSETIDYRAVSSILGSVEGRLSALGSGRDPVSAANLDRALHALREAIGADEVDKLMRTGRSMTEEQATRAPFIRGVDGR